MAFKNKQYQADMQSASHPADLGEKLVQGNIGKHAGSGSENIGSALLQGGVKSGILKEPGTSVNSLLLQGGGRGKKSRKG